MSDLTLQYPGKIAEEIGLSVKRINAMKFQGCRFVGRKTSVAWVREHLNKVTSKRAAALSPVPSEHRPRSAGNKSCELASVND